MTWLIVGGSGYIGKHIVSELHTNGIDVLVVDKHPMISEAVIGRGISYINGDITDEKLLRDIFLEKAFEGVINLAALKSVSESLQYPQLYNSINFIAARKLMDLAVEFDVPYFIQSSSAAVYGNVHFGVVSESMQVKPISPYGLSKLKAEEYLNNITRTTKMRGTSLRYFNVAGAGASNLKDTGNSNILPIFIELLRRGKSPVIYGNSFKTHDGTCVRDYIHVVDLAKAHLNAIFQLRSAKLPPVINLGSGIGTSVLEIFNALTRIMELNLKPLFGLERAGDPVSLIANIQLAKNYLKFRPEKSIDDIVISCL